MFYQQTDESQQSLECWIDNITSTVDIDGSNRGLE